MAKLQKRQVRYIILPESNSLARSKHPPSDIMTDYQPLN